MSQAWQLALLGAVQGLTEFLPVSSSAHLVFAQYLLGLQRPGVLLEAVLHLGTVAAVLVLYGRDLFAIVTDWLRAPLDIRTPRAGRVVWLIALTTAVTAAPGLVFERPLRAVFDSVTWTAGALLVTGFLLWFARERARRPMHAMTLWDAGLIGLAQAVSILPGISRSGVTIATGLWRGVAREDAARYSFLASVPAILGAGGYSLAKEWRVALAHGHTPGEFAVGFAVSLVAGTAAILWLVDFVRRGRLGRFSYYCWGVGLVMLAVGVARGGT
ncbi:MAG: undecaprenyl-diphosphate phosphatase [Armatimonadota bacterium]|nr:undecaprenyl-diphosphate phosphatase [Armatimonadota bacterium]MDR5697884.1 undecaprenyl-diphosphate phosphatase [Armatimonadota bacterium]